MIKRFYNSLPGPAVPRIVLMIVIVLITLTLLGFLFEWAGNILDDGGVIS